jgi:hypothetical protein
MAEFDEKSDPLSEFKHNLHEVIELLNQSNIPIIVGGDAAAASGELVEGIRKGLLEGGATDNLSDALHALLSDKPGRPE